MSNLRLAASEGVPVDLAPDPAAMREFLSRFEAVHLAAIPADGGSPIGRFFTDTETAIHFATAMNRDNYNVYFTANEPTPDCGNKPTATQIRVIRLICCDIDALKDGTPFDKARALGTSSSGRPNVRD